MPYNPAVKVMMHEAFERFSRLLEQHSPVDIDGTPFAIWLIDIREPSPPGGIAVNVVFGAKSQSGTHTGELHLGRERLEDEDYIVEHAIDTIRQIVRGDLPSGTRQLL